MRMFASVHDVALQARLFLDSKGCQLCSRWLSLAALLTVAEGAMRAVLPRSHRNP